MSSNLKEYIGKSISDIEDGLGEKYKLSGDIRFEVSLVITTTKNGGLNLKVLSGDLAWREQTTQRIVFSAKNRKLAIEEKEVVGEFLQSLGKHAVNLIEGLANLGTHKPRQWKGTRTRKQA